MGGFMDGWMNGWMNGWIDGDSDRYKGQCLEGGSVGWTEEWIYKRMDGQRTERKARRRPVIKFGNNLIKFFPL